MINTNMPAGGSVSPETAKQILGAAPQYQAFVDAPHEAALQVSGT